MNRRDFVASGLGAAAAAAAEQVTGTFQSVAAQAQGAPSGVSQGRWVSLAPSPEALEETLAAGVNAKLYAFTGVLPGFRPAGVMYEYDPVANAWTKKTFMPHPLHHPGVAVFNGRIYFFGGFVLPQSGPPGWVPLNETWEYTPATDTWRSRAPMPTRRGAASAAEVRGKMYVIGGAAPLPQYGNLPLRPGQSHRSIDAVEEYDPVANTWRARAPLPLPRNHMGPSAATVNGKIYAIGGRLTAAFSTVMPGQSNANHEFDPAANTWATKAPMPTARSGGGVAVMNNRVYVLGGEEQTYQYVAAFRAFEAYDPATDTWVQMPYMPSPRHSCGVAALGNRIYLVSGDVQSAMVPLPQGAVFATNAHHAFEFGS